MVNINSLIRKYKKKNDSLVENINEFKQSKNPELLCAVSTLEREWDEVRMILSALEKQAILKKPFNGVDTYRCPSCGEEMESDAQFCQYCGQNTEVE